MFRLKKTLTALLLVGAFLATSGWAQAGLIAQAYNPTTNHWYERHSSAGPGGGRTQIEYENWATTLFPGTHLVTLENKTENDWVRNNLGTGEFWIGLYQPNPGVNEPGTPGQGGLPMGGWEWYSDPGNTAGNDFSTWPGNNPWGGSEPNDSGGNEHMAHMRSGTDPGWNDHQPGHTLDGVIEFPTGYSPPPPPPPGWTVTDYFAKAGVPIAHDTHDYFRDLIADVPVDLGSGPESPIDHTAGPISSLVINFADPQNGGGTTWGGQVPFPGDTGADEDRFATLAEGFVVIPTAGDWSFAIGTDDTFELVIDGNVIGTKGCCGSPNGPVLTANLPAGILPIRAEFGENGGGAYFWLAAAQGSNVPFSTSTYRLVGDVEAGGLLVRAAIPEPSTLAICILGMLGLAFLGRRRRRRE
jgi:hypothetical protein